MLTLLQYHRIRGRFAGRLSALFFSVWLALGLMGAATAEAPPIEIQNNNPARLVAIPGMIKVPCRVDIPLIARPERKALPLTLQDCLARAISHNLDIQISGYEPAVSMTDVTAAEAAFDTVLFGSATHEITDEANLQSGFFTRTVTTPSGVHTIRYPSDPFNDIHDSSYMAGLKKRMPTGAVLQLSETLRRYHDFNDDSLYYNPFYLHTLALELKQPLLRDFGIDLNRASINAARNNYRISQQEFQRQVITIASQVETNYWRLVLARLQITIYQNQLLEGELSLRRLHYRQVLDASSETVARCRGLIERARANLTAAQNTALQQQEQLLESIDDPSLPLTELLEIIPLDPPTTDLYSFDRQEAIRIGLSLRPEIAAQRIQLDTRRIALGVAQNQILPRLDLVARQQITGADIDYNASWDRQWNSDATGYTLGVSFEIPLGNRAAQAALSKAKYQLHQDSLRLKNFERQVAADINISLTALDSAKTEVVLRRKAAGAEADIILTYEAVENAEAAIDAGFLDRKIESFDRLTSVQLQLATTLYEYNLAIINMHQAQGTLLRHNNIKLAEHP